MSPIATARALRRCCVAALGSATRSRRGRRPSKSRHDAAACARRVCWATSVMTSAAMFASSVQAQVLPPPFENMTHIVCVDQKMAIELLTVYVEEAAFGEEFLAHLATRGMCERTTFSGKPMADMYAGRKHPTGKLREMHVFEVDVTSSEVLKGLTRVYMLLYVMHDNEAKQQRPTLKVGFWEHAQKSQRALSVGPCVCAMPTLLRSSIA
jgi:hypothetical protein